VGFAAVLQIPLPLNCALSAPGAAVSPPSQIATAGATATFSLPPWSFYQWSRDGLALPGATNSTLTLTNVSRSHAGVYNAAATNSCGDPFYNIPGSLRVLVPQRFGLPALLPDGRVRLPFRDHDDNVATLTYATNYFVTEISTNLMDWQAASGRLSVTNGFVVFEEGSPSESRNRFYRIVER